MLAEGDSCRCCLFSGKPFAWKHRISPSGAVFVSSGSEKCTGKTEIVAAENRIHRALQAHFPPSATYSFKPSQDVILFNDKEIKQIMGLTDVKMHGKIVWVNDGERVQKHHKNHMVPQPKDQDTGSVSRLLRKDCPLDSELQHNLLITEVLVHDDTRGNSGGLEKAIDDEVLGLIDKKSFKIVA